MSFEIKPFKGSRTVKIDRVWTVESLPISQGSTPRRDDLRQLPRLRNIDFPQLAQARVSLLIGCDVPEAHWELEQRRGRRTEPYAVRTRLGWTLKGPAQTGSYKPQQHINYIPRRDDDIHTTLERMYDHDFPEIAADHHKAPSIKEMKALAIMEDSTQLVDGHYQIRLPWNDGKPNLPDNLRMAERRLAIQGKKFKNVLHLFEQYRAVVKDYIDKGHAEKIPDSDPKGSSCYEPASTTRPSDDPIANLEEGPTLKTDESSLPDRRSSISLKKKNKWYIPHHYVIHPVKRKIRVVFDCAAKYQGISLNDQLLQGPNQTNTLSGVLIRFRQEAVALVADIEQMFHQVKVAPEDRDALRFLWWKDHDLNKEVHTYRMAVHLFCATSSPSCSGYALRRAAQDNKDDFMDVTVDTVLKNFYVDDCLKSVALNPTAQELVLELRELLARGGVRLTKWVSNRREVLATIPENDRAPPFQELDLELDELPMERALGVCWNVNQDTFEFKVNLNKKPDLPLTRRKMLSFVASFFDPLGLMAPLLLQAKIFLQDLCNRGCDWDEEVSEEYLDRWSQWVNSLEHLKGLSITRCYKNPAHVDVKDIQLHHFADASDKGYGVASYLCFADMNRKVHCALIMGKSQVKPKKPITIPRAELVTAVVAVKQHLQILEELEYQVHRTFFWTDSMVVRQYLSNEVTRYQVFVANRVQFIRDHTDVKQWCYVPTKDNPADHASRGFSASEFRKVDHWLKGSWFL